MRTNHLRQQFAVALSSALLVAGVVAAAALAAASSDETDLGPADKVACTLSPKASIYVDEDDKPELVVDPPDIVIAC